MVNTRTDAELAAAVQAAVDAMLPQIREQVREEYRTGAVGSGSNPPPVTIHTWLERFNKQKPLHLIGWFKSGVTRWLGGCYKQAKEEMSGSLLGLGQLSKSVLSVKFFPRANKSVEEHKSRRRNFVVVFISQSLTMSCVYSLQTLLRNSGARLRPRAEVSNAYRSTNMVPESWLTILEGHPCSQVAQRYKETRNRQFPIEIVNIIGKKHIFRIRFATSAKKGAGEFVAEDILDIGTTVETHTTVARTGTILATGSATSSKDLISIDQGTLDFTSEEALLASQREQELLAQKQAAHEKEEPPQNSVFRQLIEEMCGTKSSAEQKQKLEDTMLELLEDCQQKELYCMHNNVEDLIESALNSKLLLINLKSQRLDKEK
ncbi:hypothetical protein Tco_1192313 [Tanacetum coccineum]